MHRPDGPIASTAVKCHAMIPENHPAESNPETTGRFYQQLAIATVVILMGGLAVLVWLGNR